MALGLPGPSRELSLLKTLSLIPQPQRPCEIAYLRDLDGNVSGLVTQPAHRALEAGQDGRETAARLKKEPHPHPQAWETQLTEQPEKTLGCRRPERAASAEGIVSLQ